MNKIVLFFLMLSSSLTSSLVAADKIEISNPKTYLKKIIPSNINEQFNCTHYIEQLYYNDQPIDPDQTIEDGYGYQFDPILGVSVLCPTGEYPDGLFPVIQNLAFYGENPFYYSNVNNIELQHFGIKAYCTYTSDPDPSQKFVPAQVLLLCLDHSEVFK